MIPELRLHVRDAVRPFAAKYALTALPDLADIVVISWLFFTALQFSLSPAVSRALFPVSYGKADTRTRRNWDVHLVSLVHAPVAVLLASRCLAAKSLDDDRVFGSHPDARFLLAVVLGYFIWDVFESVVHFSEVGFVAHGVACLTIFTLATRPFMHYYLVRFLLWEVSTIFLNINWFLDKTGKTGSRLQLANAIALVASFSCVRLVWGAKVSYDLFVALNGVYTQLPLVYILVYGIGNLMLQGLNWFWFTKMIMSFRKRFVGKDKPNGHGILGSNGTGKTESHLD